MENPMENPWCSWMMLDDFSMTSHIQPAIESWLPKGKLQKVSADRKCYKILSAIDKYIYNII